MCEHERGAEHGLRCQAPRVAPTALCLSLSLAFCRYFPMPLSVIIQSYMSLSLSVLHVSVSLSHTRTHVPGMYVYCAEILPTTHRQAGLSIGIGSSKTASGLAGVLLFPLLTFSTSSAGHKTGNIFQRLCQQMLVLFCFSAVRAI
jgi:hypothetical protein